MDATATGPVPQAREPDEEPVDEAADDLADHAMADDDDAPARPAVTWQDLTPYLEGQYVLHPEKLPEPEAAELPDDDEQEPSTDLARDGADDYNDDGEKADAHVNGLDKPDIEIDDVDTDAQTKENGDDQRSRLKEQGLDSGSATPLPLPSLRGSPNPESAVPSAANSPAPAGDADDDDDMDDPGSHPAPSRARFHKFPMLRPAEDFAAVFRNHADMSTDELFEALEQANKCLVAWQEENKECGRIVDDYENATRRRQQDAEFEKKTRNLYAYGRVDSYVEKDFEVKGYKAKEKSDVVGNYYLKAQDRIQAAAYGFDYDPHPAKIGHQDPELQREGMVTRRMLRNQPRQTARAAEADDGTANVVTGKRMRKPRELFDGMEGSRSSTPVPTRSGRRGPRRKADGDGDAGHSNADNDSAAPVRRGRGGRQRMFASENAAPGPFLGGDGGSVVGGFDDRHQGARSNGRKRGPRTAARSREIAADDMGLAAADDGPTGGQQASKRGRGAGAASAARRGQKLALDIPTGSFSMGPSSAATDASDESRPSTSSSSATVSTVESAYDFRPKRQRNFRDEVADEEPPRKRTRRGTKRDDGPAGSAPEPFAAGAANAATFAGQTPPLAGAVGNVPLGRPTKIVKLKTNRAKVLNAASSQAHGAASSEASPAPSQPAQDPDSGGEKDYSQMTKSEKMSHSMKSKSPASLPLPLVDRRTVD